MDRRRASIVFWNAISVQLCNCKLRDLANQLKEYLATIDLSNSYKCLDYRKMSFFKKRLFYFRYALRRKNHDNQSTRRKIQYSGVRYRRSDSVPRPLIRQGTSAQYEPKLQGR